MGHPPMLKSYDNSWTRSELATYYQSKMQYLSEAKSSLVTNGISWHYFVAADIFRRLSANVPESTDSRVSDLTKSIEYRMPSSRIIDAVYRDSPQLAQFKVGGGRVDDLVYHLSCHESALAVFAIVWCATW